MHPLEGITPWTLDFEGRVVSTNYKAQLCRDH